MIICNFGCNREANHALKNGKFCCEDHYSKCPEIKRKNSESSRRNKFKRFNPNSVKKECQFCGYITGSGGLKQHEKSCYLNPDNLRICPVCDNIIKDYKHNKTCSHTCANRIFKQNKKNDDDCVDSHRRICFKFHKKECVVCPEENVLDVHHMDEDSKNNEPENLIPLCPTHHRYVHCKFKSLIIDKINDYIKSRSSIG